MSARLRLEERMVRLTSGIPCVVEPARPRPVTPPRVTVIVLCYRYGHYLPAAVRSALDQDGVRPDVLIVDDASPDGSGDVARRLGAEWAGVKALVLTENAGPMRAYNTALAEVTGDYVVRLDADDVLTPGALARATALMEAHPEVGLTYGTPLRFSTPTPEGARLTPTSWTIWRGHDWLGLRCRRGVNCMTSPEAVIRASLQEEIGGQSEELGHTHDMEMWLRASTRADIGRVNGADAAYVRVHPSSRTTTLFNTPLQDLRERVLAFEIALGGSSSPELRAMLSQARTTVARESLDRARHAYERSLTATEPVQGYLDLSVETWPGIVQTTEWRAFERRAQWGPRWAPWLPSYFAAAARRSLHNRANHNVWKRTGL